MLFYQLTKFLLHSLIFLLNEGPIFPFFCTSEQKFKDTFARKYKMKIHEEMDRLKTGEAFNFEHFGLGVFNEICIALGGLVEEETVIE